MNRALEDLLCGVLGYGIGSHHASKNCNREISQEESESLIRSFLSQIPLDAVIDYWMEANNCDSFSQKLDVAYTLKNKADHIL